MIIKKVSQVVFKIVPKAHYQIKYILDYVIFNYEILVLYYI